MFILSFKLLILYVSQTNIQAVSETVVEALGHKNPSIRCQVGLFLSRALVKTKAAAVNKALVKLFVQALCKVRQYAGVFVIH